MTETTTAGPGRLTILDMIREGSCTPRWAMLNGYPWEAVVIGGDALARRREWLERKTEDRP